MNKIQKWISGLFLIAFIAFISISNADAQSTKNTKAPLLGWNSYDCYGTHINEKLTSENLDAFIEKLKPSGYEYFVLDAGWYNHYDLKPGEIWGKGVIDDAASFTFEIPADDVVFVRYQSKN